MNTLLTIIKGSVFNQYAFHNASAMPSSSSYGAHCFTHRTFCCLPAFWCSSIRIISFLFSQFGHKKWKNEHSVHEKSIKLYSYTSLCYETAPKRPKRWIYAVGSEWKANGRDGRWRKARARTGRPVLPAWFSPSFVRFALPPTRCSSVVSEISRNPCVHGAFRWNKLIHQKPLRINGW